MLALTWLCNFCSPCSPFLLAASFTVSLLRRVFFFSLLLEAASSGEFFSGSGLAGGGGLLLSRNCLDEEFLVDFSSFLLLEEVVVVVVVVVVVLADGWVVGAGDFRDDEDEDGAGETDPVSRGEACEWINTSFKSLASTHYYCKYRQVI